MQSKGSTLPPHLWLVLILALLLTACGGSAASPAAAPTVQPAQSDADSSSRQPAPAPIPTAAPASSAGGGAPLPPVAPAGELDSAIGAHVTPIPLKFEPHNTQQSPALKAGMVDDNADFRAYLDYLKRSSYVTALKVDVQERYLLTVLNRQQQPILNARVRMFDGEQQVFEGRTVAGGQTIFLPKLWNLSDNAQNLRVVVEKGNSVAEGTLTRNGQNATFVLDDAEALPETPRLDVLFLLDATGSMGDEIRQIQQTIASIAERINAFSPRPDLRFGLVAYRDHGDDYVTRVYDFTSNLSDFQMRLAEVRADGGGDTPEALNEGLYEAIKGVTWSRDAVRLVFLVADAPPHIEQQQVTYLDGTKAANIEGIKVFPIAASNSDANAEYVFRQIAQQTLGRFVFLTYQYGQNSGTPGDTTVHDVDPDSFTVERLDDLIVQVVQRELALAQGAL